MFNVEYSKNNMPVLTVEGKTLHSRYDPLSEGETYANLFVGKLNQKNIIVFGLACGYHILPLLEKVNNIVIFEPFQEVFELVKNFTHIKKIIEKAEIINNHQELYQYKAYKRYEFVAYKNIFKNKYEDFINGLEEEKQYYRILVDYPIYGGSLTVANYVKSALKRLDFSVKKIDNTLLEPFFEKVRTIRDFSKMEKISFKLMETLSLYLESEIESFKPDIIFFNAQSPITIQTLERIKGKNVFTVFWFVEDYSRFTYWKTLAPYFDLFVTIQKEPFFSLLRNQGCNNFAYLPLAACKDVHKKIILDYNERHKYKSDVSFMGAGYPNRISFFENLTEFDLKIWGTGWENSLLLASFIQNNGKRISMEESVKIYNSTKININLHSSMESDFFQKNGDFINPRTFEILACGGFQLVDKRSLLSEIFIDGEHLVTYDSLVDLKDKIRYFLKNENERNEIAENGYKFVQKNHTYTDRLSFLFSEIKKKHMFFDYKNRDNLNKIECELKKQKIESRDFYGLVNEIENKTDDFSEIEKKVLLLNSFVAGN